MENHLVIARLDKLSRNEDVQAKLSSPDCRWDLVVCDEAHKMSATTFGSEIKYTKRHKLGQLLSTLTRHFLLMTATPHNGKEEDFQLFMSLLDGDRFEGRFRDGVHTADVSDLMRRMVKEDLLKFDATPLFPERHAHTAPYELSDAEAQLYREVTDYVTTEFNRAEALENNGRMGTVGFALTILQRRLASSKTSSRVRLNSNEARKRADSLQGRLQKRMEELALEAKLSPLPPVVIGGVLVVPVGLLRKMNGDAGRMSALPGDTSISAARARAVIMEVERQLGFVPTDRELEKLGYDIESRIPGTGRLRFIEVKGRVTGASTVTRNEILYSLNKPDDFILAIVEFLPEGQSNSEATDSNGPGGQFDGDAHRVHYIRQPFRREPDFGVTSVNYDFSDLLSRATVPA